MDTPRSTAILFPYILASCLCLPLALACSQLSGYRGDGHLVDHGWLAPTRYELDLGSVDLSKPGHYQYRLAGLPSEHMTVEVRIVEGVGADERPSHPARLRLRLDRVEPADVVILEDAPLDIWARGRTQGSAETSYFRRGEIRYVPIGEGVTRPEAVGVRADNGWGSSFTPTAGRDYLLSLDIAVGETSPPSSARLLVRGGGMDYP